MSKPPDSYSAPLPRRVRILLVDDAPAELAALRAVLQDPAYELVEAGCGEEALALLKGGEFAVVLLGVRMPGLGGFDTARLIRADEGSRHTPMIFLTSDEIDRARLEAGYALGAVDFVVKPLSPIIVQAKVRGLVTLLEQAQRARQEAEQLRLIVQGTTDYAIFMLDPQGFVATWNAGAERLKGYRADEIVGRHFSSFYPKDVIDQGWPEHELKVATAEGRFEDEGWRLRKDGSRFWANVVITALRDDKRQLRGFSKVTRDLTERKQAEEALRRSEERFRHMVEGVQDYAIFMLDPNGNVATWNAGAERIKGYKANEITGQHFSRFYPQEVTERGWPAYELKVAAAEGRFEDEGWRVRKDGSQFWANVVITAIKDDLGGLLGFTKVTRDLTARKQAEENARRLAEETAARQVVLAERERLRVTLASIGDAVISTDAQGHVTFLNQVAEELIGWKSSEAAGRALDEVFRIVSESTRQPVENPALRALRDGKIVGLANHTVLISKSGTNRPIDDSAAPILDEKGQITGSVLVFRDITERRRVERQRNARLAVTQALSAAATADEGIAGVLEAICEHLYWDVGFLWAVRDDGSALFCRGQGHRTYGAATAFEQASCRRTFAKGEGLPGRVWATGKPAWILDVVADVNFPRIATAAEEGLHSAFACPIFVDEGFVGVIEFFTRRSEPPDPSLLEMMGTVAGAVGQFLQRRRAEDGLREQTARAETLLRIGTLLSQQLDLRRLVEIVTDESTQICGAQFGAFFYNVIGERGEAYTLYTLSGVPREAFARFPMPRNTALFGPTFRGEGVVRLGDVTKDPRYGKTGPHFGMPEGHLPVRSYLAVPVVSRTGEVLGGLFFGHADADVFTPQHEQLLVGIAGQAAVAIDNARLHQRTQAAAERLNLALTAADLGDWSWDAASDLVTFSERAAEVFGIPSGPRMTWTEMQRLLHEDDRERVTQEVERVIAERVQYDVEYRVVRPNGQQVWLGVLGRAIYDDAGRVIGMYGVVQDISERKQSEAELREAKRRFEAAFNQQFQFMAILGPDGTVLEANDTCFTATGIQREQVMNRLFWESPWWDELPHVQDQWKASIAQAAQGSGPVMGEIQYRTADGSLRHATSVVTGLKDELGRVTSFMIEGRDDTVRKRNEAVHVVQKRALELLVHNAPLAEVLDTLCEVIETQAEDRLIASVLLADEDGKRLNLVAGRRAPPDYAQAVDQVAIGPGVGACGAAAFLREAVIVTDIASDPLFADFRDVALAHGLRSCWSTPILSSQGKVLGTFAVYHMTPGTPSDEERRLVSVLTSTASVAVERRRAEAALRKSEARFRGLMEQAPFSVQVFSPDGRTLRVNQAWEDLWGVRLHQIEGYNVLEDRQLEAKGVLQLVHRAFAGEPTFIPPIQYDPNESIPDRTRYEDPVRWVAAVAYPLKDDDGTIQEVVLVHDDITARRKAEAALRESEERLRLALDAGRMGVWDWNVRTGGLKWSESLEPLHGLSPGSFAGTFEHFQQLIHPDDREAVHSAIRRTLESGSEFYVEFRNPRPNGSVHWIAGSGKVFYADDGQPLRMIGVGMDVTQRKRTEQTSRFLADASAALAVLVDFDSTLQKLASLAVPHFADWAAVDVLEDNGTLRRVAVAHADPAKIQLAHDVHRRFPSDPSAPGGVWQILRSAQAETVPEITDDMLVASVKDAELLGIMRKLGLRSYIGVPLTVRGKTLGVLTFIAAESDHVYDETDLAVAKDLANRAAIAIENTQLYRELRDADRRKDEFLATLAHELRNPLAPIRNGLQVLRLAGGGGEMVDEARLMMERQLSHMVRLVDDLLDVSRITRNKLELRKERVALATVLHSAVETSRPLIEQSGHTFSVTLSPAPVYLDADPVRLAQVFSNLLNNAAKYTEAGGRITLTAETIGAEAVVRVRDNGLGIPAEAQPRIFEMFSQVDRNMERAQGGLGIGLTLVRRLTEMHGGTVAVKSEGPGKGSEFTVRIPVIKEFRQGPPETAGGPNAARPKRRILVVDDNRDAAESLGMMLRLMGNEVRTAHDGLAAVDAAEPYRPDIILLDIGLPKLNGYDACRRIREQAWSKDVMIIALTGWGQEEDRRRSQEAGFDHHLVKPVDVNDLAALLTQGPR